MARRSRDKGQRIEGELVYLHQNAGIPASHVPLSGAVGGEYAGDLRILDLRAEVKARATECKTIIVFKGREDRCYTPSAIVAGSCPCCSRP
jgi:hypothetical protein